jgi:hypothetical protein
MLKMHSPQGAGQSIPYNSGAGVLDKDVGSVITFRAGSNQEMLKVTKDGFYVRGVKVAQDEREAEVVYNAFRRWMVESELRRPY